MTDALKAFRSADFNWTRQLCSVWRDPPYHVPTLHEGVIDDVIDTFESKTRNADGDDEPIGRVIVGPAGFGKTHMIGELRRRVWAMGGWFILLDLVGVKDFWTSVALGFLNSLEAKADDNNNTQYDRLIFALAEHLNIKRQMQDIASHHRGAPRELVTGLVELFVRALSKHHFQQTAAHRDVVTALILLISEDLDCHSIAHAWLQGMMLETELVKPFGFIGQTDPIKVVRGLSWVMSLVGPTLIAVDQIDAILGASNVNARASGVDEEFDETQSIVEALSQGLMDLHEQKRRAITVISCLEATWKILETRAPSAVTDRYRPPVALHSLPNAALAKALVAARLTQAYERCGFKPDYPTWPFTENFFAQTIGFSPRQLLKACDAHQQHCVAIKSVTECSGVKSVAPLALPSPARDSIEDAFAKAIAEADIRPLMEPKNEDKIRDLFREMLELFPHQLALSDDIDVAVQRDPDQRHPSIHGRLTFTFHSDGDREQHYCFRILEKTNAIAFQSRLKAAMTASGIGTSLKFRHLLVLRSVEIPGGVKTKALAEQFKKAGGKFVRPTPQDLRIFLALQTLSDAKPDGFGTWLRSQKPLFGCTVFQVAGLCPPSFLAPGVIDDKKSPALPNATASKGAVESKPRRATSNPVPARMTPLGVIPVGQRFSKGKAGESVMWATSLLSSHVAILAGSGSGKTVLLRRLIEEAALQGIPSIVLDINNDLSLLGDVWPGRPKGFSDEDVAAAAVYHERADVVIWTPGVNSGNPISLNLLPDFAAIGDGTDVQSQDERRQAIEMARATLSSFLTTGGKKGKLLQGVLADTLRHFAKYGGGTLENLIDLLAELPSNVSEIDNADKMASDMANHLRAARSTNPLLQSGVTSLDPQQLFYGRESKTRISVINLAGLASQESKQAFVNQLQMTLFTWIKQNPSPTGRLYVLDEAQNFVPSSGTTAASASASALTAQARKYGLGMIFATQHPKGIANGIISNCTTSVYGRMNAPNTILAVRELMAAKGGAADNIGSLSPGEFYFATANYERPVQIRTPLCLSWHPQNPPTAEQIARKAHRCRQEMWSTEGLLRQG